MTILNRRQFMQLLAGTAMAATVPLPPLPDAPAYLPSRDMMGAGELIMQGFLEGLLTPNDEAVAAMRELGIMRSWNLTPDQWIRLKEEDKALIYWYEDISEGFRP